MFCVVVIHFLICVVVLIISYSEIITVFLLGLWPYFLPTWNFAFLRLLCVCWCRFVNVVIFIQGLWPIFMLATLGLEFLVTRAACALVSFSFCGWSFVSFFVNVCVTTLVKISCNKSKKKITTDEWDTYSKLNIGHNILGGVHLAIYG